MEENDNSNNDAPEQKPVIITAKKFDLKKIKNSLLKKPTKKHLAITLGVTVVIATVGYAGISALTPEQAEPAPEPEIQSTYVAPPPAPITVASRLTGRQISEAQNKRPVTAVMIENSVDARPQSGLQEADMVFEAIAEGGITRFMAMYQESTPKKIGPIRSARPYYVSWAAGFNAAYTHSGGSGEALNLIRALGMRDMDHGNYDSYFTRVSEKYAPHNVYTTMDKLDKLREARGYGEVDFTGFSRIMAQPEETDNEAEEIEDTAVNPAPDSKATNITFNVSSVLYNSKYIYNSESNSYDRMMANQKHVDENSGKQISPTVIVALITSTYPHPNGVHTYYKTTGSGKIVVFQNGESYSGTWTKSSDKAALQLLSNSGEQLQLQPGQTWITAIPAGRVTYN